ncbi:hypothetical protein [Cylindrospermopsis raciborskii]
MRILQSRPQLRLVLLKKESHLGCHQRVKYGHRYLFRICPPVEGDRP